MKEVNVLIIFKEGESGEFYSAWVNEGKPTIENGYFKINKDYARRYFLNNQGVLFYQKTKKKKETLMGNLIKAGILKLL